MGSPGVCAYMYAHSHVCESCKMQKTQKWERERETERDGESWERGAAERDGYSQGQLYTILWQVTPWYQQQQQQKHNTLQALLFSLRKSSPVFLIFQTLPLSLSLCVTVCVWRHSVCTPLPPHHPSPHLKPPNPTFQHIISWIMTKPQASADKLPLSQSLMPSLFLFPLLSIFAFVFLFLFAWSLSFLSLIHIWRCRRWP